MTWNRRYLIKSYVRGSLWLVPFFALVFYLIFVRVTEALNHWLVLSGRLDETTSFHGLTVTGARPLLETIVTMNLSFLVFTFGSLLVAIQVAGGQYTPRIIATTLLRDNAIRCTVGYFVFTLCFALRVLIRIDGEIVHQFNAALAALLGLISIVVFLYLIDYAARMLRPVNIVRRVGTSGIAVIESMYPDPTRTRPSVESKLTAPAHTHAPARRLASPERIVTHAGSSGVLLAVDLTGLVAAAQRAGGIIELVPQVGDFVAVDEPVFRLYGGAAALDDTALRGAVAFGSERTIEQDPTFALRILVDIAIKALSAAINDPTTAVTAIDQLHRLLRLVGLRHLRDEDIYDSAGQVRLVFRTPNWEDFVHLSCIEIRHCGAGSVQIMRRMRSMLENLMQTLPPHRHSELRLQLDLLDRTIEEHYRFPEDMAIARIPDPQGLGGSSGMQPVVESPTSNRGSRNR
jgi:uncharacterized membrane protein